MRNPDALFIRNLEKLGMRKDISSGLVFVSELLNKDIDFAKKIALENAKSVDADAVYFRIFSGENNRAPIPQVYIFDYTLAERKPVWQLHKEVWSNGSVRLFYVVTKTQIKIYNSAEPVELRPDGSLAEKTFKILDLVSSIQSDFNNFSAWMFDNGTFWEQNSNAFRVNQTAYEKLILKLKNARNDFIKHISLTHTTANKLLVLSILIKYLEEREELDENGNSSKVFDENFFNRFELGYADSFISVIRKGKLLNLFNILSEHFNGKIFCIDDSIKKEIEEKQNELEYLAAFLSGKIDNRNYSFWIYYSFKNLPVELISSIYEEFLGNEKGVVYTPPFLVNLMIDECMPVTANPPIHYKLLDPACGSGIFLVSAYKRLITWWRINHYNHTGKWIRPSKEHLNLLKTVLLNSVFGVEINNEAVDLTIFSLSLALCDILSPKVIWEDLKFADLSECNIKYIPEHGFFKWLMGVPKQEFDLVIGNPPFIEYKKEEFSKLVKDCNLSLKKEIPQKQIALLFLQQTMQLVKPNGEGKVCLILPAGPLLYNNSSNTIDFRKDFFSTYNVSQIIDFTLIKPFNKKKSQKDTDVATVAVFADGGKPKGTTHIIAKKLAVTKEKQYFEFDHYDFHPVSLKQILNNKFVWKANLLGGGKLQLLIERLSQMFTLEDYRTKNGWIAHEGFIEGIKNKKFPSEHIHNKPHLPTSSFTESGIDYGDIIPSYESHLFKDIGDYRVFLSPHILIKESIGKSSIPIEYVDQYLTFKNEIVGIYSNNVNSEGLLEVVQRIKNNQLYRFYLLATSARAAVNKSNFPIYKMDIMNLPYPIDEKDLELSKAELIVMEDALNYYFEYLGRDINLKILKEAAINELKDFGETYCFALNSIYKDGEKEFRYEKVYSTDQFYIYSFYYGADKKLRFAIETSPLENERIRNLLISKVGKNYTINRTLCFYDGDYTYYIKPKALRYWLRSIALRDADDTFKDLIDTRYPSASQKTY